MRRCPEKEAIADDMAEFEDQEDELDTLGKKSMTNSRS